MRRIAREEDAARTVAVSQQQVGEPGIGDQDLALEITAADPRVEHRVRVGVAVGGHPHLQRPGLLVVLRDQSAHGALVVPGDAEGLQDVQRPRLEMHHVAVRDVGLARQPDPELLAHDRGAAVAAGEEVAAHRLGGAGLDDAQGAGDARLVLDEALERHAPARLDQRVVEDRLAQHRLDHDLAHPHRGLTRLGAVVPGQDLGALLDHAGIAEAVQLAPSPVLGERGDPRDVEIVLLRHRHGAQLVDQAEAAEQLHRTAVGDVHLGMARRRGLALDQQAAHTELRQRARESHPDRAAPRDENRNMLHRCQDAARRGGGL
jgi:hypothetical protein